MSRKKLKFFIESLLSVEQGGESEDKPKFQPKTRRISPNEDNISNSKGLVPPAKRSPPHMQFLFSTSLRSWQAEFGEDFFHILPDPFAIFL
jgi:hypothetical protein